MRTPIDELCSTPPAFTLPESQHALQLRDFKRNRINFEPKVSNGNGICYRGSEPTYHAYIAHC